MLTALRNNDQTPNQNIKHVTKKGTGARNYFTTHKKIHQKFGYKKCLLGVQVH
jgi:hypothetical protein